MFTPPPTRHCEDCSGQAPAWSCSLPELSFPSSRRCLFCSLLVIILFPKQQALSFWTLFILLSCYCTLCLNSRLSLFRRCLFCSLVFIYFSQATDSLFLDDVCFDCCRHAHCCSFCGVRSTEALSLLFLFCFGLRFLIFVYFVVFCQPEGTRQEIV